MSSVNFVLKPFEYNDNFVYRNKTTTGNNSIAAWKFNDELADRLLFGRVTITPTDRMTIQDINSLEYDTVIYQNRFKLQSFTSDASGVSFDVIGLYADGSESLINTVTHTQGLHTSYIDLNAISNLRGLIISNATTNFYLYISSDIEVQSFDTSGVNIKVENNNLSVKTNLKVYRSLNNKIITTKIAPTEYKYVNDIVLKRDEYDAFIDFLNTARLYNRKIICRVEVSETVGDRVARIQDQKTIDYVLLSVNTSQNTGVYNYISLVFAPEE